MLETFLFFLFAVLAVAGALGMLISRNPVASALWMVMTLFAVACLYLTLNAQFIGVVQILVYAGAIMVLFLFTVMLLNVPREDAAEWDRAHPLYRPGPMRVGAVLAVLLVAQLVWALSRTPGIGGGVGEQAAGITDVGDLGHVLFTDYMFPFEVTSILILTAMIGAVVLARRQSE